MAISRLLEVGKRSLISSQSAINTTANNIANVNTPGYTRRRTNLYNVTLNGQIGIGVSADDISRIHQGFVDQQLWKENHGLGNYETRSRVLSQMEAAFADSSDAGIRTALEEFWSSWNDLADDPESGAAREIVRSHGEKLARSFNNTHSSLRTQQQQSVRELELQIDDVNLLTSRIASLNTEVTRSNTPDLLDERDRLISDLSAKININVREGDNGALNLSVNGINLVSGGESVDLHSTVQSENGLLSTTITVADFEKPLEGLSGETGALLDLVNNQISGYLQKLDTLASGVAKSVNALHVNGMNLDDITGLNFFANAANGAAAIEVAPEILADAGLIATRAPGGGSGNNDIARQINELQYDNSFDRQTAAGFFSEMLSGLGNQLQESRAQENSQQLITGELLSQKASISGVSLDEEMTRLVQQEQSYEAAARLVRTADELMDSLLSIV